MSDFKFSKAPLSIKLLVTAVSCAIGLAYILMLMNVYIDTEMKPSLIIEAYGEMEYIEITDITHRYLPHYVIFLFALPITIFMFTSYSEKLKRIFAVYPVFLILADISSMYLIPYLWKGFAYILWTAGTCLGLTFLALFVLNMYDIWLRKNA